MLARRRAGAGRRSAAGGARAPPGERVVRPLLGLALAAVGLLVATGVYAAIQHFTQLDALWTTDYGRALLAKLLLLLPMLALGAVNLLGVRPALAQAAAVTRTLSQRGRRPRRRRARLDDDGAGGAGASSRWGC